MIRLRATLMDHPTQKHYNIDRKKKGFRETKLGMQYDIYEIRLSATVTVKLMVLFPFSVLMCTLYKFTSAGRTVRFADSEPREVG